MNASAPTVDPDKCLRFPSCSFSTNAYGLIHSANDLVTIWKKLVANKFPLGEVLILLNTADEPIEIARTIDALESCRFIKGFEGRYIDLKKKLSSIVKQNNSTTKKKKECVLLALSTATDELRIAYMISKMGYPLEFRNRKGPDFIIGSEQIVLLEAKSRFNRKHFGGMSSKSAKLTERGIFSLLCRDSFPLLERAFSEQKTNIALVNLSHSEYGLILAAHSYANDRKFELKKALDDALALSRSGEDSVVLIIESSGGSSDYFGLMLPRKTIEAIGSPLWEIENILKKKGEPLDFYDLAHIAEEPRDWMQRVKASAV
ncbi:MAG: hypothetical protein GEU26_06415 [Nitrososphaeraceae archaeon]|nr:hypothetical protein [Nitrososphaeraceae archaeon]